MKFLLTALIFCLPIHSQAVDHPLLDKDQLLLLRDYQLDPSFVKDFPFSAYQVVHSASQGDFYIDIPNSDYIKTVLSSNQIWEPEITKLIQTYTQPGTIAIDVGAHIGTHTMAMSRSVKENGVVIAFEPSRKIHRELTLNLKLNQCTNVIPVWAGLGAKNEEAYLEPIRPNNEGYRCISSKRLAEKIAILKLDDFALSPVSCIKIDAESYELEVLQGAYQTIMSNKPALLIEIGGGWVREQEENIDPKEHLSTVLSMLENVFDYEVITISIATGDYLAIPKS